jgi:hypothetical protein
MLQNRIWPFYEVKNPEHFSKTALSF